MPRPDSDIRFREIEPGEIDRIRPLWEQLHAFHVALAPHFAALRARRTFEDRRAELLARAESGKLKIDLASTAETPVGYAVTSLSREGDGELESMFVADPVRRLGIGTTLMQRAMAWLDASHAKSRTVRVAFDNPGAIAFYRRFGFREEFIGMRDLGST